MRVWKSTVMDMGAFTVDASRTVGADVSLPKGAGVAHVGMQGTKVCIWSLVDPSQPVVLRHFIVAGTGHEVRGDAVYVGTTMDGPYVWHVFEIPE